MSDSLESRAVFALSEVDRMVWEVDTTHPHHFDICKLQNVAQGILTGAFRDVGQLAELARTLKNRKEKP